MWKSPNEVVFASLAEANSFVIPTFYSRRLNESDLAEVNVYTLSANVAHRAACFQQMVCNNAHRLHSRAFDASAAKNPTACTELLVGQSVLVAWPKNKAPTPTHPKKRGPYRVVQVHHNSVSLEHFAVPPPADQPATLQWSAHAHVYEYADDVIPLRSALDPAASQVPTGVQQRNIECVLSSSPLPASLLNGEFSVNDVRNQRYSCRLHATSSSRQAPQLANSHSFCYHHIAHTHAFDVFFNGQSRLTNHVPIAFMPSNWNPIAAVPSQRPAFPPLPPHEQSFPSDPADAHSQ
jgi:hypothetical protein